MLETIKAAIDTKSLIEPLSYFVEDFAASNDAARLGSDLDVLPKTVEDCIMSSMGKEKQHRYRSAKLWVLAREILLISTIVYWKHVAFTS